MRRDTVLHLVHQNQHLYECITSSVRIIYPDCIIYVERKPIVYGLNDKEIDFIFMCYTIDRIPIKLFHKKEPEKRTKL